MPFAKKNKTLAALAIISSTYLNAQTVYVNSHGLKYHNEDCVQLGRNRSSIDLMEAQAKGYKVCNSCPVKKDESEEREKRKENETKNQTIRTEEK